MKYEIHQIERLENNIDIFELKNGEKSLIVGILNNPSIFESRNKRSFFYEGPFFNLFGKNISNSRHNFIYLVAFFF